MPVTDDNRLREVSKPLFGNAYRLELLAIVGDFDSPFYARQIATQMGVADNLVTSQLARLCELGLLEKQVASPHVLYTRHPSRVWEMAKQVRIEFGGGRYEQIDRTAEGSAHVPSDLDALLHVLFGEERYEPRDPTADVGRYVSSDLDALLSALAELSVDERKNIDDHFESLSPAELRVLGRIELCRANERERLHTLVRATVMPGLTALGRSTADPADLMALADVLARRLRAELDDDHDSEESIPLPASVLRAWKDERETVRGRMRATTLPILDQISNGLGGDPSAPAIADLAATEVRDLQRWIGSIDEPAATQTSHPMSVAHDRETVALAARSRTAPRLQLPHRASRVADDKRLVAAVRAGNRGAFEAIYDRHHVGILAFSRHMLGSHEEAEDVVQHTFVAAYQAMLHDEREIALKAWLYANARRRCISVLRARREHVTLDDATDVSSTGRLAEIEEREELRALLMDLQQLPDDQRAALILAERGALSHEEIAHILAVPTPKVKSLVFQARQALMQRRGGREWFKGRDADPVGASAS